MTWSSTRTSTSARVLFRVCVRLLVGAGWAVRCHWGGCAPAPRRRPGGAGRAAPPRAGTLVCVRVPGTILPGPAGGAGCPGTARRTPRAPLGQVQLQVVLDGVGRVKGFAFAQLLGQGAARQFQHGHQFGALGRARPDAGQVGHAGVQRGQMPPNPPVERPVVAQVAGGSSSSCAICSTPLPTIPCAAGASSSASDSAAGPRASSFRGAARRVGRSFRGHVGGPVWGQP